MASAILFACGWLLCFYKPPAARKLILGSAVLAPTQLFPMLQIIVGLVAISIASALGLFADGDDTKMEHVRGEVGGFVVTFLVGGGLVAVAAVAGLCLGFLLPDRWFTSQQT